MKKHFLVLVMPLLFFTISSLSLKAENVYMLGHSLVNFDMPSMFQGLADDAGLTHTYGVQVGIGANLSWNWSNPSSAQGDLYNVALPTGIYDAFIMTEAVPLLNHTTWSDTDVYLANFYNYAKTYNANTAVYLFETWHCTDSGTPTGCDWDNNDNIPWRQRLDDDLSIWEGLVDDFNDTSSGSDMLIVPGGQALARLYDGISAGNTPDLTAITDIFADNIHMNDVGNYYIACVFFATIYGQSPEGLANQFYDQWGGAYTAPSPALAAHLQRLAWQTVTNYPNSGVEVAAVPPSPIINVVDYATNNPAVSGMAPLSVHVHALNSTLGSGEQITTWYEWDFGDCTTSSRHNYMEGWNGAHVYDTPGSYTLRLTIINESYESATVTIPVVVTENTRTTYYLSSSGNDANGGLSPSTAIQTPSRANLLLTNNSTLLINRGDTIDTANEQFFLDGLSNVIIGVYGTGADPLLWGADVYSNSNPPHILIEEGGNILIESLALSSPAEPGYGEPYGEAFRGIWAVTDNFSRLTIRDCYFDNLGTSIITGAVAGPPMEGLFLVDNVSEVVGKYLFYGSASYGTIYNNRCAGTTDGHCLRLYSGPYNVSHNVLWHDYNELINQENLSVATSFPLSLVVGSDFYVSHNEMHQGMYVGYLAEEITAVSDVVLDANLFIRRSHYVPSIELFPGDSSIMIRNNIIDHRDSVHNQTGINFQELNTGIPNDDIPISNVKIFNNTFINSTSYGNFINFLSNPASGTEFTIANNLHLQPQFVGGALFNWDPYMITSDYALTGINFQYNLWQTPSGGDPFRINGSQVNMAAWMSSYAEDNFYPCSSADFTTITNQNYTPISGSMPEGFSPYFAGVFTDYNGNHRPQSMTTTGAIELNPVIRLAVKLILGGAYDAATSCMNTDLNDNGYLPTTEPYTAMGWNSGSEETSASVLAVNPVVDWVLVELRDKSDGTTVLETTVGLLLDNGQVINVNGDNILAFSSAVDSYYIVVKHRNHLAAMTASTVLLSGTVSLDFTSAPLYGGSLATEDINGRQTLWSGDVAADGLVNASDRSSTWNDRNQSGYLPSDADLSGGVNAADRSITWNNRNKAVQLP